MAWNIKDLKEKEKIIQAKLRLATDERVLTYLRLELENIQYLINFSSNESSEYLATIEAAVGIEKIKKKCSFLERTLPMLSSKTSILDHKKVLPTYLILFDRISKPELTDLTLQFYQHFNVNGYLLLQKMLEENAINFSKCSPDSRVGFFCYLPSFDSCYIDVQFARRMSYVSTLAHEVAHAHVCSGNLSACINMTYSLLNETYPFYVELMFLDFLKQTKHYRLAFNCEESLYEELVAIYEYNVSKYQNLHKITYNGGKYINFSGETINIDMASRFISTILAYYFKHLCDSNEVNNFLKAFTKGQEYEYFDAIDMEKMVNSIKSEIESYYNGKNKRQKSIIKCYN